MTCERGGWNGGRRRSFTMNEQEQRSRRARALREEMEDQMVSVRRGDLRMVLRWGRRWPLSALIRGWPEDEGVSAAVERLRAAAGGWV
jgi:hypothetical protein